MISGPEQLLMVDEDRYDQCREAIREWRKSSKTDERLREKAKIARRYLRELQSKSTAIQPALTEQEIIWRHLTIYTRNKSMVRISTLMAGLRDARGACNRYAKTGLKRPQKAHGSWLETIGYLILLDHIGKCFKPSGKQRVEGSEIRKALKYFTALDKPQIDAICALRHAFAHDYGLYNKPSDPKRTHLQHHFVVCAGNGPIVAIQKKWEGGLDGPVSADQQTWVNLERVQELVEMIYRQLKRLAINSQLEIEVEGGALALDYHYQLFMPLTTRNNRRLI